MIYVSVQVLMSMCAPGMYMQKNPKQQTSVCVIPQELCTLFSWDRVFRLAWSLLNRQGALSTECLGIFYIKPPCPTFSDVFWGSNSGPSTCMGITFPSELSPALNFLFLLSKRKRWRTFPNKHQLKFGMLLDDLQKHNKTMP